MAELKTQKNNASVTEFLNGVESENRKQDSFVTLDIIKKITNSEPSMWGASIVGFGSYHYKYASGREGDWFVVGFSPGKQNLTIYIMSGFSKYDEIMSRLGKFKTGKSCLYINKLEDIDLNVLEELIVASVNYMKTKY
ncbi:MAG: DUF1801 domain-containing protein [Cyclobacteriaceae bacterium]|nr:DUF1801 domain-containing protein [Cyclobacteriaceae bacterium]